MLSSKTWMCLVATGFLLAASTHSMAQSGSRYPSAATQRTRTVQRSYQTDAASAYERVAPAAPRQARVAQAYVPQHLQNGIQTGVVAPVQTITEPEFETVGHQGSGRRPAAHTAQIISGPPIYDNVVGSGIVGPIIEGPIVEGPIVEGPIVSSHVIAGGTGVSSHSISTGCSTCPSGSCGTGFGGPVDLGVGQSYFDGGCGDGSCDIGGDCCGRGGCPPYALQNCWLNGLFGSLSGAEFFLGGAGFRSQLTDGVFDFDDSSFGFYGGFNVGIPLCRLTCGLISGQFGVRHVTSNFDGNSFTDDTRNQTFFTAGLYRRVDYGLQVGVVADVLREEWFTSTQTVQLRGDIAWVYPRGSAFGFRFTDNLEDDVSNGIVNGQGFTGLQTTTLDTYRFYYRHGVESGGFFEVSGGWTGEEGFLVAFDHDLPISQTVAIQSNLTYVSNDEASDELVALAPFVGDGDEAWNISIGLAWRPRGRAWYRSYNTPLLPVADNGTFIQRRGFGP